MDALVDQLLHFKYLAMFGVLVLCGLGLPVPEEATLLASGVLVGLGQADFFLASAACVSGILVGDSFIFFMGRRFGRRFLKSRLMRWALDRRRQARVRLLFSRHGLKAVFFARFFFGVRMGVYAYAGQHGMRWLSFIALDLLGALISGPTSIWIGKFAAETIAPQEPAPQPEGTLASGSEEASLHAEVLSGVEEARRMAHEYQVWIYAGLALLAALALAWYLLHRRRKPGPAAPPPASGTQARPSRSPPRQAAPLTRSPSHGTPDRESR